MKRLFSAIIAFLGISSANQSSGQTQMIDLKNILYSVPTISNDIAELAPGPTSSTQDDLVFHEDEWTQVEFLPRASLPQIQAMMKEYKSFEAENRTPNGWKKVYVRNIERKLLLRGTTALDALTKTFSKVAGRAPILYSSGSTGGRVKDGFTFDLGGSISLYGVISPNGISVLGASVGRDPNDIILTETFAKLSAASDLVLVDWRGQMILISQKPDGSVEVWRP